MLILQCSNAVGSVTGGGTRYLDPGAEHANNETTGTVKTESSDSMRVIETLSKSWSR